MKSDAVLRTDIEDELSWDPSVDARAIGVAVKDGVVTLSGHVKSFAERWAAERIVKAVAGVKVLANEIEVRLAVGGQRSDTEIAEAAAQSLKANVSVPSELIAVVVRDGWVTLDGTVPFWYQKMAAENSVKHLWGVKGVTDQITIRTQPQVVEVKSKIENAFKRHAQLDAEKIRVRVAGGTVSLEGDVSTWLEREEAEHAAWAAPGVAKVENKLAVRP